jgi:hypothetical protein
LTGGNILRILILSTGDKLTTKDDKMKTEIFTVTYGNGNKFTSDAKTLLGAKREATKYAYTNCGIIEIRSTLCIGVISARYLDTKWVTLGYKG